MGDGLPGHTCPAIDDCKRVLRRMKRAGEGDPVEIDALLRQLEGLRAANTQLREGFSRVSRELEVLKRQARVVELTKPDLEPRETLGELDPELILYDGLDEAIVGVVQRFGMEPVVVYDLEKVREVLARDGGTFEEVEEHITFNILGLWAGDRTPAFLEKLEQLDP